jgi:hypothetical protein
MSTARQVRIDILVPSWLNFATLGRFNPMLTPTTSSKDSFVALLRPANGYWLSDVRLDIPNATTAIFKARLNGPKGSSVWARAWLSTEAGTLAEAASSQLKAGDEVELQVILRSPEAPEYAYMRIESAPLHTEHIVRLKLI